MKSNYAWKPIERWTIAWHNSYLPEVFAEFKQYLTTADLEKLSQRSAREWSIETGQIENAFDLDRGVTMALIEQGFMASLIGHQRNGLSPEQVHAILLDTKEALDGLFEFVKAEDPLTTSYIRQLHQQLMRNVETYRVYFHDPVTGARRPSDKRLEPGKYKEVANNPYRDDGSVHEYCPPEEVPSQMEALVELFNSYGMETAPEVRAAWLHHAFTQIHPFQDGNGRVARALASLVLIKSGLPPLTVPRQMKGRYIRSLEAADHGNGLELVAFIESCLYRQIVAIWRELQFDSGDAVSTQSTLDEIIQAAQRKLVAKHGATPVEWGVANSNMHQLLSYGSGSLQALTNRLHTSVSQIDPKFSANLTVSSAYHDGSMRIAKIEAWEEAAAANGYEMHMLCLQIDTDRKAQVIMISDPLSGARKGILGTTIVYVQDDKPVPIEPSFFLNFKEPLPSERYGLWLDEAFKKALVRWQSEIVE